MVAEDLKQEVSNKIRAYQEANFWECYPSGGVKDWIVLAVATNIVYPMQVQIESLKAEIESLKNSKK